MSEYSKRKLRQTTLQFASSSSTSQPRKRKMDQKSSEQKEKKTKQETDDVVIEDENNDTTQTSEYFNINEKTDDKEGKDLRPAKQQEKSRKAAEAAEKRQTKGGMKMSEEMKMSEKEEKGKDKEEKGKDKEEKEKDKEEKGKDKEEKGKDKEEKGKDMEEQANEKEGKVNNELKGTSPKKGKDIDDEHVDNKTSGKTDKKDSKGKPVDTDKETSGKTAGKDIEKKPEDCDSSAKKDDEDKSVDKKTSVKTDNKGKYVPKAGTSVDPPKEADNSQNYVSSSQENHSSDQTDEDEMEWDIPNKKPSALQRESSWRGTRLAELNVTPTCLGEIKQLGHKTETVLFRHPYKFDEKDVHPPAPYPTTFMDKWDTDHVRMPCSPHNEYPIESKGGKTILRRRWELIEEALHRNIPGPFELEEAILTYNQRYANKWNFASLKQYFTDYIRSDARKDFFANLLPKMVKLALQLPLLCTQPIPLLKQHKKHTITMSQQQVACLLANAFFCTFPRRNARQRHAEYTNYPEINFNVMFQGPPNRRKMEKLKCIVHYFSRVTSKMPLGTVSFERKVVDRFPIWEDLGTEFCKLHVSSSGTIEDDGKGMLQADFANKYIGGGVLGHGCVQEEIRFLICPEMIITRLFTEVLDKNESLLMSGCEQFSKYDGYADTFSWDGDFQDKTPRDINGRRHTDVIAIDALVIRDHKKQFQKWCVLRELNKAYAGFHSDYPGHQLSAVCTGNWGCGAFGGDKRLKALIQLMAASVAKRDVCYFTFDDNKLTDELYKMHNFIKKENGLSVGNIMELIDQYNRNVCQKTWWGKPKRNLFEYIVAVFEGNLDSDTTGDDYSEGSNEGQANFDTDGKRKDVNRTDSEDFKANTP